MHGDDSEQAGGDWKQDSGKGLRNAKDDRGWALRDISTPRAPTSVRQEGKRAPALAGCGYVSKSSLPTNPHVALGTAQSCQFCVFGRCACAAARCAPPSRPALASLKACGRVVGVMG